MVSLRKLYIAERKNRPTIREKSKELSERHRHRLPPFQIFPSAFFGCATKHN